MKYKILITGAAGFIGYHLALKLLLNGYSVYNIDNLNNSYSKKLKIARLKNINIVVKKNNYSYKFLKLDLKNKKAVNNFFNNNKFEIIIHLAAQAGVRDSMLKPKKFFSDNVIGFLNLLEGCKKNKPKHLLYASSSAVYGNSDSAPFKENDDSNSPASIYGVTKKTNEITAFSFSSIYTVPTTGLRFFTVYGPFGRPDMAYYKFTKSILSSKAIEVYDRKKMLRDFIYIDDVTDAITKLIKKPPKKEEGYSRILNLGNNKTIILNNFVKIIENICQKKSIIIDKKMPIGDVTMTHANISRISKLIKFKPKTTIENGLKNFVRWYQDYEGKN